MSVPSTAYKYFAFISYSRKDSKAAAWLQKRLEWFRFPVKLVPEERRPPNPRYIRPIYRDKTNLEVSDEHYWTNIRRALEESRYLVVLCSPHSAKSEPVNMEMEHFLATHSGDTSLLVPVISSGNVTSTGEDAALCPALRALGDTLTTRNLPTMVPDAATAEQDAWEAGFVALISYLLQLGRTAIGDHIQRETKRQATVLRRWLIAVGVLTMMAITGGWYGWSQAARAKAALVESNRQLERSQVEVGRAWLERANAAKNKGDHLSALMLAGRAVGYQGYGRGAQEAQPFSDAFPLLLARPMQDPTAEKERAAEAKDVSQFLDSVRPTLLPLWGSAMSDSVTCVTFCPDGSRLASGSEDNTLKLWDTASGKELASLQGHTAQVSSVAFSPDGSRLASGSNDTTIKLWDAVSDKELASLKA